MFIEIDDRYISSFSSIKYSHRSSDSAISACDQSNLVFKLLRASVILGNEMVSRVLIRNLGGKTLGFVYLSTSAIKKIKYRQFELFFFILFSIKFSTSTFLYSSLLEILHS